MAGRPYSYATLIDVHAHLAHFPSGFNATSAVAATMVHSHIQSAADELDAALAGRGYSIPVATGASMAWSWLRAVNAIGGAMYTAHAQKHGEKSQHLAFLERRWTAILGEIRAGDVRLSDATQDATIRRARYGAPASAASPYFRRVLGDAL